LSFFSFFGCCFFFCSRSFHQHILERKKKKKQKKRRIVLFFFPKSEIDDQGESEGLGLVGHRDLVAWLNKVLELLLEVWLGGLLKLGRELHVQGLSSLGQAGPLQLAFLVQERGGRKDVRWLWKIKKKQRKVFLHGAVGAQSLNQVLKSGLGIHSVREDLNQRRR